MFLTRLALHNVRSIESLALEFGTANGSTRRWTLLLGENGCGKSSVLKATALLLAGSDALPEVLGEPDAWIRNGANQCTIEGSLVTADGALRDIQLVIHRGDGIKAIFERNSQSLEALDAAIAHTDRNYFTLGYGVSRRPSAAKTHSRFSEERSRSPRAQGMATMFSADAALVSLEQWAMDLDYRKGNSAITAVQQALDKLLPGMSFSGIDRQQRQIMFKTVDGEVPLSQLSDGYQNMAAWCGDLLYRITEAFPDRKEPLLTRGVLLIDELDLHLHPIWRRNLVEFLTDILPHFQFIATTHSALTAQQCGEGELYVLRREGDQQRPTVVPFIGEPRKMMLHQLLMSPMFGLASMDSVQVEEARTVVRLLATKKTSLTSTEKNQLSNMRQVLQSAPNWDVVPPYEKEQTKLLKEIKASLTKNGKAPVISSKKLKATAKMLEAKK